VRWVSQNYYFSNLKRILNLPPDEPNRILIVFVIADEPSTIPSSPTSFVAAIFRPFQVNIVVLLPHHSGIILVALLGCVNLLRSVDRARKEGIADKDNICIYGGSYGGYACLAGLHSPPTFSECWFSIYLPWASSLLRFRCVCFFAALFLR